MQIGELTLVLVVRVELFILMGSPIFMITIRTDQLKRTIQACLSESTLKLVVRVVGQQKSCTTSLPNSN